MIHYIRFVCFSLCSVKSNGFSLTRDFIENGPFIRFAMYISDLFPYKVAIFLRTRQYFVYVSINRAKIYDQYLASLAITIFRALSSLLVRFAREFLIVIRN